MVAQPRRVGRPSKNVRRVELRLNADDPMTAALEKEAAARHTTLQQHIIDILTARYLYRGVSPAPPEEPTTGSEDSSKALSDEWM